MSAENKVIFKPVLISHPNLSNIISPSVGIATEQKIHDILISYKSPNHHLIGAFSNEVLIGVSGFEIAAGNGIIKHISILEPYRGQQIGRNLIIHIAKYFSENIIVETDDDSVEFYRKCGFQCLSFNGQYGKRYRCDKKYSN